MRVKKIEKSEKQFLGRNGAFDLEIGQRIEIEFGGIFFFLAFLHKPESCVHSTCGKPVAPASLCNSHFNS